MKRSPAVLVLLLALLLVPSSSSCKVATQAYESTTEFVGDAWIPLLCTAVGAIFGPIGAVVGGTCGGAYAVTRQRLYHAQDLAKAFEEGRLYGRQQVRDMVDAARGAKLDKQVAAAAAAPLPWYRSNWAIALYIILGTLTFARLNLVPRAIFGPNRLRTLARIYLGWLVKLPA